MRFVSVRLVSGDFECRRMLVNSQTSVQSRSRTCDPVQVGRYSHSPGVDTLALMSVSHVSQSNSFLLSRTQRMSWPTPSRTGIAGCHSRSRFAFSRLHTNTG